MTSEPTRQDALEAVLGDWGAKRIRNEFKRRYGRGWQGKLASRIGIADSTLSNWLKEGRFPTWAKLAISAVALISEEQAVRRVVQTRDGHFSVIDLSERIGRTIAENFISLDEALLCAAAPVLLRVCSEAHPVFDDAVRAGVDFEGWEDMADQLERAISLAQTDIPTPQKEEDQ